MRAQTETKTKKTVTKKPAAKTTAKKSTTPRTKKTPITIEQRHKMICEAAFYIAQKNNFESGMEMTYWLDAEKEIDNKLLGQN